MLDYREITFKAVRPKYLQEVNILFCQPVCGHYSRFTFYWLFLQKFSLTFILTVEVSKFQATVNQGRLCQYNQHLIQRYR